jgi:hypothetical protein
VWTAPLRVEVGDLSELGGGIPSLWIGADPTTKTLHLRGADGKHYVLRSVDKFVKHGLPESERGTPIETILQDQISAHHPSAALVVAPLLRAAGVLHADPRLLVVPDDPRLGEFREEFAGLLVLFQERPDEGQEGVAGAAASSTRAGTERLLKLLDQDAGHRVDARAFLTARLVDLLVGDRDRKVTNWEWARFDDGDRHVWRPVPRNHDQAFVRLEGFLRGRLRRYNPRLVAFGEDYSSIVGLTRSAWDIDRPFLAGLDKSAWDSVVTDLQGKLTDSVIDAAVQQLPPEHHRLVGADMAQTLKRRRDRLQQAADKFYQIVSGYADIHASNQPDRAVIDRIDENRLEVWLSSRGGGGGERRQTPYFHRTFDRRETREVRLYLLGSADRAVVRGTAQPRIRVRIVGGDGADALIDSSQVGERLTDFYESGDRPETPDWGRMLRPAPVASFNADHGLILGGGIVRDAHGFGAVPYSHRLVLRSGVSTSGRFLFEYRSDFPRIAPRLSAAVHAVLSGVHRARFHGFGNETERQPETDFHRVTQYRAVVAPTLTVLPLSRVRFSFGPVLKVTSTSSEPTRIVQDTLYGAGLFGQVGAQAAVEADIRDQSMWTTRGLRLGVGASVFPAVLDVSEVFAEVHGELATYVSMPIPTKPTLAIRLGGQKVWGRVPFHEAAYVGGENSLRGFEIQRFAGDAALHGNAELRLTLVRFSFLFPTELGVLGVADVGRVFLKTEPSGRWHAAEGAGIWIAPLRRAYTVSFTLVRGTEQTLLYVRTGFQF